MYNANYTGGSETQVVEIDDVIVAERVAHCRDKTGAKLQATWRDVGAAFQIPKQGDRWTVERNGWQWVLGRKWDTPEEHAALSELDPGETRIISDGILHIFAEGIYLNGEEFEGGGGGTGDHGALTGLGDDDHLQYHTDARGDARYARRSNNLSDLGSASTARTNLGLGNVDNTSDANKPVSTAQQAALDLKAPITSPTFLVSAFAPTVSIGPGTNIATIGAVNTALGAYLTAATAASTYVAKSGDTMSGNLTIDRNGQSAQGKLVIDVDGGQNTQVQYNEDGTERWAHGKDASTDVFFLWNNIASAYSFTVDDTTNIMALTQTPTFPTKTASDSSTSGATTAFVKSQKLHDFTLPTAATPMNGQKFTGLAAGTTNGDSVRYEQVVGVYVPLSGGTMTGQLNVQVFGGRTAVRGVDTWWYAASGDSNPAISVSTITGFGMGAGGSSSMDWYLNRTGANEATLAAGDVLKMDTAPEGSANTVAATTEYVDRATGHANANRPVARVHRTSAFSIPNNSYTPVTFNSEATDTDGMVDIAGQPTRITCVTPGTYVVTGSVEIPTTGSGIRAARIAHFNSSGVVQGRYANNLTSIPSAGNYGSGGISEVISMSAGDYLQLEVYQNSGGSLNTAAANQTHHATLSAAFVGGTGAAWGNAGASVYKTSQQTMTTASTWYPVTFDAEIFDTDGMHDTSSNTERLTVVTPGTYQVQTNIIIAPTTSAFYWTAQLLHYNAAGSLIRRVAIQEGYEVAKGAASWTPVHTTGIAQASAGDYFMVQIQTSLASMQIYGDNTGYGEAGSTFSAVRIGYQTNPAKDGQLIQRRTMTGGANTGTIANGTTSVKFFGTDLSVQGDGVNYVKLELNGFGPYIFSGTAGHFNVCIWDETNGVAVGSGQFYVSATGITAGQFHIVAYLPPFTGTRAYNMRFQNTTGSGSSRFDNQANAAFPTFLVATWAGSSGHF